MADLSKISIGIKTFLRNPHLLNTISAIVDTMPEVQMIIADDGDMINEKYKIYAQLVTMGHIVIPMDFDSGFGAKSNAIVDKLSRPYVLIGSDDFDFWPSSVREGIDRLAEVLDNCPEVDIASGRVNNRPYEFDLIDEGDKVTEIPLDYVDLYSSAFLWYADCDLTVNYSLIRKDVFEKVRWDDATKIGGGEHGSMFLDCKRAGFYTVYVQGVNIDEQQIRSSNRYREFRSRANNPERPCFDKRGIKTWILGDGRVDYHRE